VHCSHTHCIIARTHIASLLEHKWYHCIPHIAHIRICSCWQHVVFTDACRAFVFVVVFWNTGFTLFVAVGAVMMVGIVVGETVAAVGATVVAIILVIGPDGVPRLYARPVILVCMSYTCILLVCLAMLPHQKTKKDTANTVVVVLLLHIGCLPCPYLLFVVLHLYLVCMPSILRDTRETS
jgi:hypothetical protein